MLMDEGEARFRAQLDVIDCAEAVMFEALVMDQVRALRDENRLPAPRTTEEMRQVAISQSQFLCGNCTRVGNTIPYESSSFSVKRGGRGLKCLAGIVREMPCGRLEHAVCMWVVRLSEMSRSVHGGRELAKSSPQW